MGAPPPPPQPVGPPDPHLLGTAVSRLGNGARKSGKASLLIAGALLDEGENVECAVAGRFEGEPAAAVLTDRRVLLVNERPWSPSVTILPVDGNLAVQGWQDDRTASLTFIAGGRQMVIEQIGDRPLAVEVAGRIRARTAQT